MITCRKEACICSPGSPARGPAPADRHFMRSLAEDPGRAVDRRHPVGHAATTARSGIEEIKAAGGITFAQDDSAQQTSMPRSAVASGGGGLRARRRRTIARELGADRPHPFAPRPRSRDGSRPRASRILGKLFEILRKSTGIEFGDYKAQHDLPPRSSGAWSLHRIEGLPDYVALSSQNDRAEKSRPLYQDMLINVTSFFRDPETFEAIKSHGVARAYREPLAARAACASGCWGARPGRRPTPSRWPSPSSPRATGSRSPLQVFATDLNGVGHREGPRRGVPEGHRAGRLAGAPAALLRRDGRRLPHREADPRDVRLRPSQRAHRAAVLPASTSWVAATCSSTSGPCCSGGVMPILHYALDPGRISVARDVGNATGRIGELFAVEDAEAPDLLAQERHGLTGPRDVQGASPGPALVAPRLPMPHLERARHVRRRARDRRCARPPRRRGRRRGTSTIVQFRGRHRRPICARRRARANLNLLKMLREGLLVGVRAARSTGANARKRPVREEGCGWRRRGSDRATST